MLLICGRIQLYVRFSRNQFDFYVNRVDVYLEAVLRWSEAKGLIRNSVKTKSIIFSVNGQFLESALLVKVGPMPIEYSNTVISLSSILVYTMRTTYQRLLPKCLLDCALFDHMHICRHYVFTFAEVKRTSLCLMICNYKCRDMDGIRYYYRSTEHITENHF